MDKVVSALLLVIGASFIVSFILYVRLKARGLDVRKDENWNWIRAVYPSDLHRLRFWLPFFGAMLLACLVTAVAITWIFDLCPNCSSIRGLAA